MRKIFLPSLFISIFFCSLGQSSQNFTIGTFDVELLGVGDTATSVSGIVGSNPKEENTYTGKVAWTIEQQESVERSLTVLNNSLTNSAGRQMRVAIAMSDDIPIWALGGGFPSMIYEPNFQHVISTGELLWRDGDTVDHFSDAADILIVMNSSYPWHFGTDAPKYGEVDFQTTITHEVIHGLGISGGAYDEASGYLFGVTKWDSLIQDLNGNQPIGGALGIPETFTVVGPEGTVYWAGAKANATYGGPVPIFTSTQGYMDGSSLIHPGPFGELMSYASPYMNFPRAPNKLLLDMFRDMGWSINEDLYNNFGPTYYGNGKTINQHEDFTSSYDYTYAMYVHGNKNQITQSGQLQTVNDFSRAFYANGDNNQIKIEGTLQSLGDHSQAFYMYGLNNTIYQQGVIQAQGTGSTAIHLAGMGNILFHSGSTIAKDGAVAVQLDHPYPLDLNSVHVLTGSIIEGNIINSDPNSVANMSFGRIYSSGGVLIGTDPDFYFSYSDNIKGLWEYHVDAGTLHLVKNGSMEGYICNNATFQEDGEVYGNIYNRGVLKGNGTTIGDVENRGIVAPGNSIGTLTVKGNYTQYPSGDLQIEVGDGKSDKLIVTGTANLAGSVTFIPIGYVQARNVQFLSAGQVDGRFTSFYGISTAVLDTSLATSENGSYFVVTRNPYTALITDEWQRSLAGAFDQARPSASDDMANILNYIDFMDLTGVQQAIDDFSPQLYNSITAASIDNVLWKSGFLRDKINRTQNPNQSSTWLSAIRLNSRYNDSRESREFTSNPSGLMLGVDEQFFSDIKIGVAAAYTNLDLNEAETVSDESGYVLDGYLYGYWQPDQENNYYLQTTFGVGQTKYDTTRSVEFLSRIAESEHNGTHYSVFAGGGYKYKNGPWTIEPRAGLDYVYLNENNFQETKAGAASLSIQSKQSDALVSSAGLRLSHKLSLRDVIVIPSLMTDWMHDFMSSAESTSANLESGETFLVGGRDAGKDSMQVEASLALVVNENYQGYVSYKQNYAEGLDASYQLVMRLEYLF